MPVYLWLLLISVWIRTCKFNWRKDVEKNIATRECASKEITYHGAATGTHVQPLLSCPR